MLWLFGGLGGIPQVSFSPVIHIALLLLSALGHNNAWDLCGTAQQLLWGCIACAYVILQRAA